MNSKSETDDYLVRPKESQLSETTENYLKRILWLSKEKGTAKVSEIADLMGRSLSSTTEAMKRLGDQGYINYEKYTNITLTQKGYKIATQVNNAYNTIASFLQLLGLPKDTAHEDACSMEHSVTNETVKRLEKFLDFLNSDPVNKAVVDKFVQSYRD